jgi:urea transporter
MERLLAAWEARCAASSFLRFVDVALRGIGQVMFQDNPLSGLLFLAAIVWGASVAGAPFIALAGVVAVVVGTATARWLRVDAAAWRAGLFGYNAVLVGLALATFIEPGWLLWVYVLVGAAVSVVATLATASALRPWGVAALTAPFVLVTWLLLLGTYGLAGLAGSALPVGALVTPFQPAAAPALGVGAFTEGILLSISQVFLKGDVAAALLFIAGLAVSSRSSAVAAVGGAVLAVTTAHAFGAESDLVTGGLLGFSPVLTAVALGAVFRIPGWQGIAYAALATIFTVFAQAALNVALTPLAIPALTAPFVLVSWIFLLPRQSFSDRAT